MNGIWHVEWAVTAFDVKDLGENEKKTNEEKTGSKMIDILILFNIL